MHRTSPPRKSHASRRFLPMVHVRPASTGVMDSFRSLPARKPPAASAAFPAHTIGYGEEAAANGLNQTHKMNLIMPSTLHANAREASFQTRDRMRPVRNPYTARKQPMHRAAGTRLQAHGVAQTGQNCI